MLQLDLESLHYQNSTDGATWESTRSPGPEAMALIKPGLGSCTSHLPLGLLLSEHVGLSVITKAVSVLALWELSLPPSEHVVS